MKLFEIVGNITEQEQMGNVLVVLVTEIYTQEISHMMKLYFIIGILKIYTEHFQLQQITFYFDTKRSFVNEQLFGIRGNRQLQTA